MMRPERRLIKLQERSDSVIREDLRLKKCHMREIRMRWSSHVQKSQMVHMISASAV